MRQGTTPTIKMILPDEIDVSAVKEAILTIAQHGKEKIKISLAGMKVGADDNSLTVTLLQGETLELDKLCAAEIQLKIKIGTTVTASNIMYVPVSEILNKEEI